MKKPIMILCLCLSACATPKYEPINLMPENIPQAKQQFDAELKSTTVMLAPKNEQTGEVKVAPDFLNLWKESLQTSVDKAGIFADDAKRKISIEVHVKKFDFNPTGFSNKVTVEAVYKVIDRSTRAIVFEHNTITSSKMGSGEIWVAFERLKRIWNRATQESIHQFMLALNNAKI
ncbi:MAG: hypothetical protein FWG26_10385 [Betaproteobacteria bacterium]|nr:hypothetical protein [Betaproteobacteria bacterium]